MAGAKPLRLTHFCCWRAHQKSRQEEERSCYSRGRRLQTQCSENNRGHEKWLDGDLF